MLILRLAGTTKRRTSQLQHDVHSARKRRTAGHTARFEQHHRRAYSVHRVLPAFTFTTTNIAHSHLLSYLMYYLFLI